MKNLLSVVFSMSALCSFSQSLTTREYKEDFNYFWNSINDEYCYFNKKQTDWKKVKDIYMPLVDKVTTRNQFVSLLERVLYEIYDHHANLNTNTDSSRRLVPSGADIWAEYINGKPMITEVRKGFGASACGIIPGMEVIKINGRMVSEAIELFLPKSLTKDDTEARNFALRLLLAGDHTQPRAITLKNKIKTQDFYPDQQGFAMDRTKYASMVESKLIGSVGYVRINDFLYDNSLIPQFDSVMQTMNSTTGLILDLRETPSGGNTSVARAILGWFTAKDRFYQQHEYYSEEKTTGIKRSWQEIVSPRKQKLYIKPLVVLCDHWTGSIAEGITIGFDGLKRPETIILGTAMAGLNGAVYSYEMPFSKIHFSFPAERLYHVNGLPRENYRPRILVNVTGKIVSDASDLFIDAALRYLRKLK